MENITEIKSLRDYVKEAVEGGRSVTFRADPIITTTDADVINKDVAGIDVLHSPALDFLKQLGVTFYTNLTGNFAVPSMAQDTGIFVAEASDGGPTTQSANMAPDSLVLSARRVSHTQSVSKETLAQTSPDVYNSIVNNLVNGLWNAVTYDVFDTLQTDGATRITTGTAPSTFTDYVNLESSIGGLQLSNPAYVTGLKQKAHALTTAYMTNQGGIWQNDKVNGYDAYAVPAANAGYVYFGDWSRVCVGQWGSINIIVDPYTNAKKGLIDLTVEGLFDTGCYNPRAFAMLNDGSTA